ncbi:hypothetical protein [Paraburkholderia sp. MM5477-R1]|uniref:hypothetical protein n=1 Tax=Paraburkholderia sp. MM5477-R1 TaxID=2991062 RepID=UPI003D194199
MALTPEEKFDQAVAWLADADALLITQGAGMGVDSGLPAFRGRRGLWKDYPALKHLNMDFARISTEVWQCARPRASPEAFTAICCSAFARRSHTTDTGSCCAGRGG